MANILFPGRWTNQPPVGAQINYGHPLARGLFFYQLMNAGGGIARTLLPNNLAPTTLGTVPSPTWSHGSDGSSPNFNGNWSYVFTRQTIFEPTWVSCVTKLRRVGTLTTSASPFCKAFHNAQSAPFTAYNLSYNNGTSSQDTLNAQVANQGGTLFKGANINAGTGATLVPHTVGFSVGPNGSNGQIKTYLNGIIKDTTAVSGMTSCGYDTTSTGNLIVSGINGSSTQAVWSGDIYYIALYNRVLTDAEMEWLNAEPYALLATPKSRKFFFGKAGIVTTKFAFYITMERLQ